MIIVIGTYVPESPKSLERFLRPSSGEGSTNSLHEALTAYKNTGKQLGEGVSYIDLNKFENYMKKNTLS